MGEKCDNPNCNCSCHRGVENEHRHKAEHDSGRRDFLKYAGLGLIGLGIAPALSYWLRDEGRYREIIKNPALAKGKAQRFTILHTSDMHGQVDVHDEFFWENGRPVF